VVDGHGWDCAESVELTKWTRTIAKSASKLPAHALATGTSNLNGILLATHRLRHTAVHRLPTTARGISELIGAALKCAEALQDSVRALQLEELRKDINVKIEAMELNKNALEDTVRDELKKIRQRREELNRMEEELMANMKKDDLENKSLIGSLLEDSMSKIFGKEPNQVDLEEMDEGNIEPKTDDDVDELGGEETSKKVPQTGLEERNRGNIESKRDNTDGLRQVNHTEVGD
jgi:hypothetical protein